ncbi:diguanylate cyclase domain-containing protein [Paenibacillus hexagrammi]|uniref:Diguanylate cyclase n=1 Tax=Paenibacillus hexagrammi TaxID=2908839 RepID=A0ABY3SNX4_9BACL|nr:diguanylate cyclase [Paenibacillus sp. YPD9-1]UJF34801.1 diguanylate cyclase [Paenibacillus sp. YPD9-1]
MFISRIVLRSSISEQEFAARVGGDEFLLMSRFYTSKKEVEAWIHQVENKLQTETFRIGGSYISVSACFGISLYPDDGDDLTTLSRHSDQRMLDAKRKKEERIPR